MAHARSDVRVFLVCGLVMLEAMAEPSTPPDTPDPDFLEYLAQHDEPGVPLPQPGEPGRPSSTEPARPASVVVKKP